MIVWDNGEYGTTGGQDDGDGAWRRPRGSGARDGIAAQTATVRDGEEFGAVLARARAEPGPWVIVAKVAESRADREAAARLRVHQAAIHGGDRRPEAATQGGTAT